MVSFGVGDTKALSRLAILMRQSRQDRPVDGRKGAGGAQCVAGGDCQCGRAWKPVQCFGRRYMDSTFRITRPENENGASSQQNGCDLMRLSSHALNLASAVSEVCRPQNSPGSSPTRVILAEGGHRQGWAKVKRHGPALKPYTFVYPVPIPSHSTRVGCPHTYVFAGPYRRSQTQAVFPFSFVLHGWLIIHPFVH